MIHVKAESPRKDEFELNSHTNENVGDVKARIAERLRVDVGKLSVVSVETGGKEEEVILEDGKGPDGRLVYQVGNSENQQWIVKSSGNSSSSSTAVVVYEGENSGANSISGE